MNNQRLRNLTTGRLHTSMKDIYKDVEFITGETGVMTHQLLNAFDALQPWLKAKVSEPRFWDGAFDQTHQGETELAPMNEEEKTEFWERYKKLPSPLTKIGTNL